MIVQGSPWRLLLPIIYMAIIYALSSVPGDRSDNLASAVMQWVTPGWQNLVHIPLYAGLTLIWIWALDFYRLTRPLLLSLALVLTATWGILDELHQAFVPGRYASITDMILNLVGAVGAAVYSWRTRYWRQRGAD